MPLRNHDKELGSSLGDGGRLRWRMILLAMTAGLSSCADGGIAVTPTAPNPLAVAPKIAGADGSIMPAMGTVDACIQACIADNQTAGISSQAIELDCEEICTDDALVCLEGNNKKLPSTNAHKVYYGTRNPTHVALDGKQALAVVAIGFGTPRGSGCSGTLITDRHVLTASHCTEGMSGSDFYAIFGVDDDDPVLSVRASRLREHPSHDMAILELSESPLDSLDVTPIPLDLDNLTDANIGDTHEQAGYGRTESGYSNGRFFVAERLWGFSNGGRNLVVDGEGVHGVCFGDSGGPSLRTSSNGETRLAGVLSHGDSSCVGHDNYSRVDVVRDWIEEWTGPTPITAGGSVNPDQGCGAFDFAGTCDSNGNGFTFCDEGGERLHVECAGDEVCGWAAGTEGWRCVVPEADPCEGITFFGGCDNGVLSFCENGTIHRRDCGSCGETCALADSTIGYACLPVGQVADLDGDNIPDVSDLCSGTAPGARVWTYGEWLGCASGQVRDAQSFDSDQDGVADSEDLCSASPLGRPVWTSGEWMGCAGGQFRDSVSGPTMTGGDLDFDGVPDSIDTCSGTPANAVVWTSGQWLGCAGGQTRDSDR